jgi:5-methyltetrahydrofolate--homocysteine methyltransferase
MSSTAADALKLALQQRIVVIDGAMGSMIQEYKLDETDYRGSQFVDHAHPLMGAADLLSITRPDIIEEIHYKFAKAGADIIETNTFSATSIAMADYHMQAQVRAINLASVACAQRAVQRATAEDGKQRWVAGSIGPTNRTASLSPDVNDPGYRAVTFADLVAAYREQVEAMLDAGVDILLPETSFDTLNLKAALFAISDVFDVRGPDSRVPIIASVTITDRSGRTLSGQTLEAFYNSISNHDLLAVSINCALGADDMRPYVQELSTICKFPTMCYPNAGLPNEFGGYDDTPLTWGNC